MARPLSTKKSDGDLFTDVASADFLEFKFGDSTYQKQLDEAVKKSGDFCAITCRELDLDGVRVMHIEHNWDFLGGSLGCAEGERITRGFEHATAKRLPVVVSCKTGGARMQEGALSLMQMAKVSVAVDAHRRAGVPFVSVLEDPTYGGVSASYSMQADVRIGVANARIGFAGPGVILNTMFEQNQAAFDLACPPIFQSAEYVLANGGLDIVVEQKAKVGPFGEQVGATIAQVLAVLAAAPNGEVLAAKAATAEEAAAPPDYTKSRKIERPHAQDIMRSVFDGFVELKGDGKTETDSCIKGGLARIGGWRCVVLGTTKGHTPKDMQDANFGMPSPAGYRTALRLFGLAERFGLPVVTLVDTVGAWPSFVADAAGQSEAIATNLTAMAGLTVPIVTVVIGEGGSGGALGIAMGNRIGMASQAYYGVISPEGAASILGKYKNDAHKATQFPIDCRELATGQQIYAKQLQALGAIDEVLIEGSEAHDDFPAFASRLANFVTRSIAELAAMSPEGLVADRCASALSPPPCRPRSCGRFVRMRNEP